MFVTRFMARIVICTLGLLVLGERVGHCEDVYQVLDPRKSAHLKESEHFVARWDDKDHVKLTDADLDAGLKKLEANWRFYTTTVGFPVPAPEKGVYYKVDVNLSDRGWATGSGTGARHPAMWLHFNAFKDKHALAHEFAHSLQFTTQGMRDSKFVGWFWECHAEWMTHQMYPDQVGCSDQLVNAPHLYYGSTRDRYGNWQFWEYIKDTFGYPAINDIWTKCRKTNDPKRAEESPLGVLRRNMNWSVAQLNDQFGLWAMHNVAWDYKNAAVYRRLYGGYHKTDPAGLHRVSLLDPVANQRHRYAIPDYHAPQRYGYNLVRIELDPQNASRRVVVRFHGVEQRQPARDRFSRKFENEPDVVPQPDSDWRWGLVAVTANGSPRYSPLQRGASSELSWQANATDQELYLAVVATPSEYHTISWDQMYYTIYRYPWTVDIQGGQPEGIAPAQHAHAGAKHANGGGWVDKTAHVDPTAYVGPDASVLDHANVLENARVEDHAVVSGKATLKGEARVSNHAMITGNAVVEGKARIVDEAAIYDARVEGSALVGALTVVTGRRTHIRDQAIVRAVMNIIDGFDLGGTVQLLGDIELRTSLSKGVFYGMVTPEMANDPKWGAARTVPEQEVTQASVYAGKAGPSGVKSATP